MLDLFTVVWGQKHADLLLEAALPSLLQPGNLPAARPLIGTYTFYSIGEAAPRIQSHPNYSRLAGMLPVAWEALRTEREGVYPGWDVTSNILVQMERSLAAGNHMLIVSPDWVMGDGSLRNLAELCQEGWNPVLFGLIKASPTLIDTAKSLLPTTVLTNRWLVRNSLETGGGAPAEMKPEAPLRWTVSHRAPTPCLRPDPAIIDFFKQNFTPNQGFDHVLPVWMVLQKYPVCFVPHSDMVFIAELAEAWRGGSGPWELPMASVGDNYFRQYTQTWEGGEGPPAPPLPRRATTAAAQGSDIDQAIAALTSQVQTRQAELQGLQADLEVLTHAQTVLQRWGGKGV